MSNYLLTTYTLFWTVSNTSALVCYSAAEAKKTRAEGKSCFGIIQLSV